jgi:C1A family cysteine protease
LAITTTLLAVHLLKDSKAQPTAQHHDHLQSFHAYNRKHGKTHHSKEEFAYRFAIYQDNKKYIDTHNSKNQQSFTLGENQFADLTFEEFSSKYLSQNVVQNEVFTDNFYGFESAATKVDWREKGVITQVKNQGACGSCWAFSVTGSFEAAFAIAHKELVEFSESELVDCSSSYGNHGCNGGLPGYGYKYIKDNKIGLESDYPYRPVTSTCHKDTSKRREGVKDFKYISPVNVEGLKNAIATTPVSVGIEVRRDFQLYHGGVYTSDSSCGSALNHGVTAVGFDAEAATPFFIVKNSWGGAWGESGYIRVAIGSGSGTCGIANKYDVYPIL